MSDQWWVTTPRKPYELLPVWTRAAVAFRDWWRGYSASDIYSARMKYRAATGAKPGSCIQVSSGEMQAAIALRLHRLTSPMTDLYGWDRTRRCCGNCFHWALSPYGEGAWKRREGKPSGAAGYGTDGTASDCRAHAPRIKRDAYTPGRNAAWPHTEVDDCCGDFERRP